jgi:hypothetical protein
LGRTANEQVKLLKAKRSQSQGVGLVTWLEFLAGSIAHIAIGWLLYSSASSEDERELALELSVLYRCLYGLLGTSEEALKQSVLPGTVCRE